MYSPDAPARPGNARLTIYCLNSQDTIVLGYKYFIVRNLPDPCLEINGICLSSPSSMSKSSLVAADSISVLFSDDIIGSESWFRVTDFTIGYNYGGFHVSHHNLSNKLSLQTKQIISRIAPDREISISLNIESDGKIKKQLPIYRIRLY